MSFSFLSTPQHQQSQQQQTPFSSPPFGNFGSLFTPQQQPQQPLQQSPLQSQQQQQQTLFLFTNDKAPASYSTKWSDLHPDSQKFLQKVEDRVREYRDESLRLDQSSRLHDSSVINEGFEADASHVLQDLTGITSTLERQKVELHSLMSNAKVLLRNAEVAIRSYLMQRPRFLHSKVGALPSVPAQQTAFGTLASNSGDQSVSTSVTPVLDFYSGLPKKPSPFLQQTVARFESCLTECSQWIEEIEQLLADSEKNSSHSGAILHYLPQVMTNVHQFFVHVAAKAENIHQYIESMKAQFLVRQRDRGDGNDPFLEADRRERAKIEAASKRKHPTLHLPSNPPASAPIPALPSTTSAPAVSAATSAATGSAFPLFSAPAATPSTNSFFFSTPTSAPASSIFASSMASPQTSLFPSSAGALFGAASSPSLFSTSFGTPASTGGVLSSTPFASGSLTGSGASFGAATKSQRPKSRTARR